MKVFPIPCSERARWRLSTFLGVVNFIAITFGIILIILGLIVKFRLAGYIHLLNNYDVGVLPALLISAGALSVGLHLFAGFLFLYHNNSANRRKLRMYVWVYLIFGTGITIIVLAAGISCHSHVNKLKDALHGGILKSMGKYINGKKTKRVIDQLQMEFECCGSAKYTDWFHISWIPEAFRQDFSIQDVTNDEPQLNRDHVPFSCCNPLAARPCISSNVHNNAVHTQYDFNLDLTLYRDGCRDKVAEYFGDTILYDAGATVIALFFAEAVLLIAARYLQTSTNDAMDGGYYDEPAQGYLFLLKEERKKSKLSRDVDDFEPDESDDDDEKGLQGFGALPLLRSKEKPKAQPTSKPQISKGTLPPSKPKPLPPPKSPAPVPKSQSPAKAPATLPRSKSPPKAFALRSKSPAPVPKSKAPTPAPRSKSAGPVPRSKEPPKAPLPKSKSPAPALRSKSPPKAPALPPKPKSPAPVPKSKAPALPKPKLPTPALRSKSPAPLPKSKAPVPAPRSKSAPAPKPKQPVPAMRSKSPAPPPKPKPPPKPAPRAKPLPPPKPKSPPPMRGKSPKPVPKARPKPAAKSPKRKGRK